MKKIIKLTESDLARIVKRVIKEQEEAAAVSPEAKIEDVMPKVMELSQELGSNIDPKTANEVMSCSFDEIGSGLNLKPEAKELLDKVKSKIKQMVSSKDREGLKNAFSELKSKVSKSPPTQAGVNEQAGVLAGTFALMGITAPLWAWVAVGAIVLILLIKAIVNLTSWIPRKKGRGCSRTVTYRVR